MLLHGDWKALAASEELGAFRPEPRHALIVAGGPEVGKINLLWGSNGKQILSDAAVLNEGTEQWTPRSFTEGDTENPIAAKAGAAYTSNQNFIYIFGGMCSTEDGEAISNELVRVDTTTGVIERMSGRGQIPCPRLGASLTFIPKDESRDELLLVFGGYTSSQEYLNDTYVYNLRACQWTRSRIEGDAPDPREGHSAIYYPGDELSGRRLIIHGGYSKIPGAAGPPETLSDVAFLNLDRGVWISQPGPNTSAPYARAKHTASLYGSKMVVIGGERSPKELLSNIAASFCLRELAWEDLELRGSGLPAEGLSGHGAVVGDNQVLVFMGRTGSEATELSEKVFSLSLSPALPPQGFQAYFDENRQGLHASWKVSRSIPGRKFELLLRRASDPVTSNIVAYTGSATSTTIKSYKDSHRKVQPFKQGETYIVEIQELDGESSSLEWFKNEERHINQLVVTIGFVSPPTNVICVASNPTTGILANSTQTSDIQLAWDKDTSPTKCSYTVEVAISFGGEIVNRKRKHMIEELPSEDQTMESRKDTEWQTLASVLGDNHLFIPNSTLDTLLEMHPVDLIQVGATSNLTQVTFRFRVLKTAGSRVSAPSEEASVSLWKMPAVKASAIAESVTNGESVVDTEDEEVLMGGVVQSVGELSSAPATPVPAKATPIIEKATSVPTSPTRPNVPAPIPEKITQVTPVAQAIPPIEKSVIYSPPTKIRRTSTSPKKKAETEPLPSTVKPTPKSTHDNAAVQDVSAPAPVVTGQESGQSTPRITSPAPVEESIEEFATDAAVAMDIGEPTSMILHTDPETGRPKLDDPVNGHWFNFRFGESIEAFSLSPVPGWYRARTLYYSPSGDSDWRVKIHYSRYPKQFDETIVLNEEGRGRLRPPSSELVGEGDGEEDERVFDPNSSAKKLYAISAKERELAKQGIMIVRRR